MIKLQLPTCGINRGVKVKLCKLFLPQGQYFVNPYLIFTPNIQANAYMRKVTTKTNFTLPSIAVNKIIAQDPRKVKGDCYIPHIRVLRFKFMHTNRVTK